jgi:hypothetical protein
VSLCFLVRVVWCISCLPVLCCASQLGAVPQQFTHANFNDIVHSMGSEEQNKTD